MTNKFCSKRFKFIKNISLLLFSIFIINCSTPPITYRHEFKSSGKNIYIYLSRSASDIFYAKMKKHKKFRLVNNKKRANYFVTINQKGATVTYRVSDKSGKVFYIRAMLLAPRIEEEIDEFIMDLDKILL